MGNKKINSSNKQNNGLKSSQEDIKKSQKKSDFTAKIGQETIGVKKEFEPPKHKFYRG